MDQIRQYLLSVTAAALLCSIANGIIGKNGAYSTIVKMISGIFLALTVISPWTKLPLQDFSAYANGLSLDADLAAAYGQSIALEETSAIIKAQTEAYILDKAVSMGLTLDVEVTLNQSDPPLPCAVTIQGSVSPFSKEKLSSIIANDLGIPEDDQLWT